MALAYRRLSSRYDDEVWALLDESPGPPPRHLSAFVSSLAPAAAALDLGCGDGRLSELIEAGSLTIADVSEVALARARARLAHATAVALNPDACLPFADNVFDLVLCADTLEHVRDVQLLLSEVRRVMRPGGRLALTTPAHGRLTGLAVAVRGFERYFDPLSPHLRFLSGRSLARLLDSMGFEVRRLSREAGTLLAIATR